MMMSGIKKSSQNHKTCPPQNCDSRHFDNSLIEIIQNDSQKNSRVFVWIGPVRLRKIKRWSRRHKLDLPAELLRLLSYTGGGDFFETESILCPFPEFSWNDGFMYFNNLIWHSGVPKHFKTFHMNGGFYTAYNQKSKSYVEYVKDINNNTPLKIKKHFETLKEWYISYRLNCGSEYGLAELLEDSIPRSVSKHIQGKSSAASQGNQAFQDGAGPASDQN